MEKHVQLKLGVNIDHVATLRQVRGTAYPDVPAAAAAAARGGAHGITVHLREDRRHIRDADVFALVESLSIPLNLEMANVPEIVEIALRAVPDEVCMVPERREELTTEGGLDVAGQFHALAPVLQTMARATIRVSLFVEPDPVQIRACADVGAPCIELHTGTYCEAEGDAAHAELDRLVASAELAHDLGLQVNAGHGIHLGNLPGILEIPHLDTLNIGHSIVCNAVFTGLEQAVREMLTGMGAYTGGRRPEVRA